MAMLLLSLLRLMLLLLLLLLLVVLLLGRPGCGEAALAGFSICHGG